jgi:murein DD-endopeptidase MepM/ murein hydrolase activator NlpD
MYHRTSRFRRRRLPVACVLIAALIAGVVASPHGAADNYQNQIDQTQQQRDQVGGIINVLNQKIQEAQNRENQLRAAIAALDAQITQQMQRIADQQAHLDQVNAELAATRDQLEKTRQQLRHDREQLAAEVIAIYEMGNDTAINNLLGAGSFNDFWQRMINIRRVAGAENAVVARVHAEETAVQQALDRIAADQQEQTRILGELKAEADQLRQAYAARAAAESQLEAAIAEDQHQLALAEQSARELEAQIAALKEAQAIAAGRGGGNGHFVWPEQGPLTQNFGCTTWPYEPYDPNCPSKHFHTGIDIGDPWGNPIVAGDTGIAYTYISSYGYGNHIIIVHGNGWVSVYGHMSSFVVGDGQTVRRGELIGYEGSTGNSSGPHLHFEVRLNDNPVNPLQYLP